MLKALLDGGYLHGDCMTVTGKTMAENLADVVFPENRTWCSRSRRALARPAAWSGSRAISRRKARS